MRQTIAITFLVLSAAATSAQADVYRWVDAQGRVHFSDKWVPGSELVKVDRSRANSESEAARRAEEQARLSTTNDLIEARQAQNAALKAVNDDVAAARAEQCKQAKEQYDRTIQARRLYRTDENGQQVFLSDAEAQEARVQARMKWQEACGPAAK